MTTKNLIRSLVVFIAVLVVLFVVRTLIVLLAAPLKLAESLQEPLWRVEDKLMKLIPMEG